MKLIIIFLLTPYFCFSQKHTILDSKTKKPISYVAIRYDNIGFYSNEKGQFIFIEDVNNNLDIEISCLGYSKLICKKKLLKDTIYLNPKIERLREIVIHTNPPILKKIGFKKKNMNFFTGGSLQLAMLIKPNKKDENSFINEIICISV